MTDTHIYSFPCNDMALCGEEIARTMGYHSGEIPEPVSQSIETALAKAPTLLSLRGGYRIFSPAYVSSDHVQIDEKRLETGTTIARLLAQSEQMAIFVCTAGPSMETWSKKLMAEGDLLTGYAVDAIASEAVERACDKLQALVRHEAHLQNLGITNRYCPGYCGWHVAGQQTLFSLLPPDFCGVHLTSSSLMTPIKSVSGAIGIGAVAKEKASGCSICELTTCTRRKLKYP